jgi:hypothetical protein
MNLFKTVGLSLGLVLASTAIAAATPQGKIKANTVVCTGQTGIEAARADMNVQQLLSLGCTTVETDLRVDVLPPSGVCDPSLFVAATLPEKIVRFWIKHDELNDGALFLVDVGVDCQ